MLLKSDSEVKEEILRDLFKIDCNTEENTKAIKELIKQTEQTNKLLEKIYETLRSVSGNSDRTVDALQKITDAIRG